MKYDFKIVQMCDNRWAIQRLKRSYWGWGAEVYIVDICNPKYAWTWGEESMRRFYDECTTDDEMYIRHLLPKITAMYGAHK